MGLIISIPITSKAATYYNYGDQEITYDGYLYGFYLNGMDASGLPQNYKISSDVFENLIESNAKGFQLDLASRIDTRGIIVGEWALNGVENYCNFVYGLFTNAYQALGSFSHDFIWRGTTTYSWNYYFTGADPNYPGNAQYGTAYGFRFIGACGDKFDFVLDENGDFYGHSVIGNWTPTEDPEPTNWILINQGLDNFYVPSGSFVSFNDLKSPFFEGSDLHVFIYDEYDTEHEVVFHDMTRCALVSSRYLGANSSFTIGFIDDKYNSDNHPAHRYFELDDVTYELYPNNRSSDFYYKNTFLTGLLYYMGSIYIKNTYDVNYPSQNPANNGTMPLFTYDYTNVLGFYNNNFVSGSVNSLWLEALSYTPVTNPNPFPEEPIPITSIPEDPEDPLPNNPTPDPVPGIEYPVNPTPPIYRPLPSIVSGNDDLWPSVVELENIEIGLGDYIGSLDNYEFPDLSSITSSFSGAIIWVSTIMSTLFNGSDFSILFAVLSSFFIVAALLGLYKWWNHK